MLPLSREMIASDIPWHTVTTICSELSPDSRCPECAADIATSIVVWEDLQKTLGDIYKSDPRARRIAVAPHFDICLHTAHWSGNCAGVVLSMEVPTGKFTLGVACTA